MKKVSEMRIYVVGSVASGKTTFSKKLSKALNMPCTHLDGIVHVKDQSNKKWGNTKRSDDEIDDLFSKQINKASWIIEDAGRKCFSEGMEKADCIVHLKPSVWTRKRRILTRFIKQKLGLEACLYRPSLKMLKAMFFWLNNYETAADGLEKRLEKYNDKTKTLRHKKDIEQFILQHKAQKQSDDKNIDQ